MIAESGPELGDLQPLNCPKTPWPFAGWKRTSSCGVKVVGSSALASLLLTGAVISALHGYPPATPEASRRRLERSSFEIFSDQPNLPTLADLTRKPPIAAFVRGQQAGDASPVPSVPILPRTVDLSEAAPSRTAMLPPSIAPTEPAVEVTLLKPAGATPTPIADAATLPVAQAFLVPPVLAPTQEPGSIQNAWSPAPAVAPVPVLIRRPTSRQVADVPKVRVPRTAPEETASIIPTAKSPTAKINVGTVVGSLARQRQTSPRPATEPSQPASNLWKLPSALAPTE